MAKSREAIMDDTDITLSHSEIKNGTTNGNGKAPSNSNGNYSEQDIQIRLVPSQYGSGPPTTVTVSKFQEFSLG